ncbi:MAG: AtpZ/AtpI family protein [Patescibacteria group bacterium]
MATSSRRLLWQALSLAWELGYTIALPLVLFALAGRWADKALGTKPWLFLTGVVIAIVSTSFLLVRKFSRLMRDMNPVRTSDKDTSQDVLPPSSKNSRSNGVNPPKS